MDSDGSRFICIALLIALVIVRAFYRAFEYAMTEVNDSKIKSMAEKDKRYGRLEKLLRQPSRMIVSFSMGKTIAGAAVAVLSVIAFCPKNVGDVQKILLIALIVLASAIMMTALTDMLPRKIASKRTEPIALFAVLPVKLLIGILSPVSMITYGIATAFGWIFGVPKTSEKDVVTEEEILMMVDAGNETGVIEESQKEMINNIFEFGDSVVSDVMTHRKDICAIEINSQIKDVVYLAINEGYSRIPVYEESVDNILGVMYVKDLLCLVGCEHSEDFTVKQFMRKAMYVPESGKCKEIFEEMTLKKAQMAVVSDEYGGTAGIVTMEDLLEEIVGNIQDEYDEESAEISEIDDGVYTIDGDADPEDVAERLGFELPEEHQYDTMSAFIVDLLGRIPEENETPAVMYGDFEFTVLLAEDNWISKLKAVCLSEKSREYEE